MPDHAELEPWYSVRCVFAFKSEGATTYEERITVWLSSSSEGAIARAEQEAGDYAEELGAEYVGLAQSFHLAVEGRTLPDGDEVFSLMRDSELGPDEYISRFFDTGSERQGDLK
ncbi:MAG TPA: hypothetical protein VK988_10225 [Acidimicrobiales bacterium]|nr:hypothetical protein [Acidimicrobiales bacterium]